MKWFNQLCRKRTSVASANTVGASTTPRRPYIESLESRRLMAAQVFTPTIPELGPAITFDVIYTARDDNDVQDNSIKTTGVALRMHYDSTEVSPDIPSIEASAFAGATVQDSDDTDSDFDNDPETDRYVNFLWFDISEQFPVSSQLPLTLVSAKFDAVAAFDALPNIRFSGSPPPGFEFRAEPLTAAGPWTNPSNRFDVNNKDGVTALDALNIINALAAQEVFDPQSGALTPVPPIGFSPPYYDVNVDGKLSAIDALQVINELARGSSGELVVDAGQTASLGDHLVAPDSPHLVDVTEPDALGKAVSLVEEFAKPEQTNQSKLNASVETSESVIARVADDWSGTLTLLATDIANQSMHPSGDKLTNES